MCNLFDLPAKSISTLPINLDANEFQCYLIELRIPVPSCQSKMFSVSESDL